MCARARTPLWHCFSAIPLATAYTFHGMLPTKSASFAANGFSALPLSGARKKKWWYRGNRLASRSVIGSATAGALEKSRNITRETLSRSSVVYSGGESARERARPVRAQETNAFHLSRTAMKSLALCALDVSRGEPHECCCCE